MKLIVATNNPKKLVEFSRILQQLGFEPISLQQAGVHTEIEETGTTFAQNAYIKAMTIYKLTGLPCVADDSGLCIDYLFGQPGVYSARYGGQLAKTDDDRMDLVLQKLQDVPQDQRQARFVSAICCVLDEQTVIQTEGRCEGYIGFEKCGTGGFGYDPIFMVGNRSYAQMTASEKDSISHRGKALEQLKRKLEDYQREEQQA